MIKEIRIENYKSIQKLKLELGRVTVLIGENGCGKSSLECWLLPFLLDKHFNRLLADDNVEILDPATGIGTFITALIDYLPKNCLRHKYINEIHCNEVAILPYYIIVIESIEGTNYLIN